MIKINQLKLRVNHTEAELQKKIEKTLKLRPGQKYTYSILKRSIDARKKPELFYVYTVSVCIDNDTGIVKKVNVSNVSYYEDTNYVFPVSGEQPMAHRPVIIGAGPAGLFCAYLLTLAGYCPIVLERGAKMEERKKDVDTFWQSGGLKPDSNVQFGEGGAGTFSDGKLNTAVKDPMLRNRFVLDTFVKFGAPAQIKYDAKPHIGTDILSNVIMELRNFLVNHGCDFYFHKQVVDFVTQQGKLSQVICQDGTIFSADVVVLAPGHSARDTFMKLHQLHVPMEAKNFAVGFRVEHPQSMIDETMYGSLTSGLPASPYKVTSNFPNGRGVYSFCMCPGGYVVNSSSALGQLVVNGMSYSGRNGSNANSAIIVSVGANDFGDTSPLGGMHFQEELETKAFALANGKIPQQLYGDYRKNISSASYGAFSSETKGATAFANLRGLFSPDMEHSFIQGMEHFGKIIPGFDREDAILSGVESRTSSPIRILRNEHFQSKLTGLYPCGEGAGYAGGIMSAAMDGMKVAEAIIKQYSKSKTD